MTAPGRALKAPPRRRRPLGAEPATPDGDCSLLRIAHLYANILQLDRPAELANCFGMLTDRSARVLGHGDYGLRVGNPADVVIIDAGSPAEAVALIAQPVAAFKRGRQTMVWETPRLLGP